MSNYDVFAEFYDSLTKNVDYAGRADYVEEIIRKFGHCAGITLDLACGTGSLTLELFKRGYDIYGIDASPAMLMIAKDKAYDIEADILFLCQNMQTIDLYGTVDTVICSLDSINHLKSLEEIKSAIRRVSLFMAPDGLFIFDFNTIFKHKNILSNNIYIYDMENIYCVWKNKYHQSNNRVDISLDFFEKQGKVYSRSKEHFSEISFEPNIIKDILFEAGFKAVEIFDDLSFDSPKEDTQRIVFVAKK